MIRQATRSTRIDTLLPYATLFRSQARRDAAAAADERWRAHIAQLELLTHEGDYDRGWTDAWGYHPSRLRWWLFGMACGLLIMRSEERRVGTECVSTCRSRRSPDH